MSSSILLCKGCLHSYKCYCIVRSQSCVHHVSCHGVITIATQVKSRSIRTRAYNLLFYTTTSEKYLNLYTVPARPDVSYFCHACMPLPQRPSAANSCYKPLAVRVHPPVPTSDVSHGGIRKKSKPQPVLESRVLVLAIGVS